MAELKEHNVDIGANENGYRWVIEDQSMLGKGYVAKLWREGQNAPTLAAGREGFSTRESAVAWATEYRGGEFSLVPIVFVGTVAVVTLAVFALVLRALIVGPGVIRVVSRVERGSSPTPLRWRATARPIPTRSRPR